MNCPPAIDDHATSNPTFSRPNFSHDVFNYGLELFPVACRFNPGRHPLAYLIFSLIHFARLAFLFFRAEPATAPVAGSFTLDLLAAAGVFPPVPTI
jgi:hypothetical protein